MKSIQIEVDEELLAAVAKHKDFRATVVLEFFLINHEQRYALLLLYQRNQRRLQQKQKSKLQQIFDDAHKLAD